MSIVRAIVAVAAALLPRRYWRALEPPLPVSNAVLASAVCTLLAGAALGVTGFLAHATETARANNEAYLQAATKVKGDTMPTPSGLNALAIFTFFLLTPQGWASGYLMVSGIVRTAGALLDDPHGDFILTLIDGGIRKVARTTARRAEIDNRHLLEGPHVRDRIVQGAQVDLPQADLVVVASRIKDDWDVGTVLLSNRGEFRIAAIEDRTIDGRLRRLYALAEHKDLEVFRRTVQYEFPEPRA